MFCLKFNFLLRHCAFASLQEHLDLRSSIASVATPLRCDKLDGVSDQAGGIAEAETLPVPLPKYDI